jgi:hypothetical protein
VAFKKGYPAQVNTNNTTSNTEIIDTLGKGATMFLLSTGTLTDADMTSTASATKGDQADLGDSSACDDNDFVENITDLSYQFDDDNANKLITYIGDKRYVRVTQTPAGNTGNNVRGIVVIQSNIAGLTSAYDAQVKAESHSGKIAIGGGKVEIQKKGAGKSNSETADKNVISDAFANNRIPRYPGDKSGNGK